MKGKNVKKIKQEQKSKKIFDDVLSIKKYMNYKIVIIVIGFLVFVVTAFVVAFRTSIEKGKEDKTEVKMCSVIFNTNGGVEIEPISIECGKVIDRNVITHKNGFDFQYWSYEGEKIKLSDFIINETLYVDAEWKANDDVELVTISFDSNGGSEIKPIYIKKGELIGAIKEPVRKGYIFEGWTYKNDVFDFGNSVENNIILTASWKKKGSSDNDSNGSINSNGNTNNSDGNKNNIYNIYDEMVNKYNGRWYLKGYSDVYIDITKNYSGTSSEMTINAYNFSFEFDSSIANNYKIEEVGTVYPCTLDFDHEYQKCTYGRFTSVKYINWEKDLESRNMKLNTSSISLYGKEFVRDKGTKSKYINSNALKMVGTWFLKDDPYSELKIFTEQRNTETYYCVVGINFNIYNFSIYGGSPSCENAYHSKLLEHMGIELSNNVITITNQNGTRKFVQARDVVEISDFMFKNDTVVLVRGQSIQLELYVTPSNAYTKDLKWYSSAYSVARVDSTGKVIASSLGTATITVESWNGKIKRTVIVKVVDEVDDETSNETKVSVNSVKLNKSSLILTKGKFESLTASVLPFNATNKNVEWSSSNTSVATVNDSGKVTAVGKGTATITVTTIDGGYKADCTVTVVNPPLSVKPSIGVQTSVSSVGVSRGISVEINASGGTGVYNYTFKVYKNGVWIETVTDSNNNKLFLVGHTNGSYKVEYEVRDSDGETVSGSSSTTISGF